MPMLSHRTLFSEIPHHKACFVMCFKQSPKWINLATVSLLLVNASPIIENLSVSIQY